MKYSNIRVLVARSQKAVEARECDDVKECDTIKEAKAFARYSLTPEYQASGEFSEPMNYACVMACEDGRDVCVADYFRRGYVPPVATETKYSVTPFHPCNDLDRAMGTIAGWDVRDDKGVAVEVFDFEDEARARCAELNRLHAEAMS